MNIVQRKITSAGLSLALMMGAGAAVATLPNQDAFADTITKDGKILTINEWKKDGDYWKYYDSEGNITKNKWIQYRGSWYYLNKDGLMNTAPYNTAVGEYRFHSNGALAYGWVKNLDKWYYAGPDAYIKKDAWVKSGSSWYYLNEDGVMLANTKKEIDGKTYIFDSSGAMETGLVSLIEGKGEEARPEHYYANPSGALITLSWKKIGSSWYYFGDDMKAKKGGKVSVGDTEYYFNNDGIMQTGWIKEAKDDAVTWYWANGSGALAKEEWKKLSGKWYYFNKDATMHTGKLPLENNSYPRTTDTYLLGYDGAMITGWVKDGANWSFYNASGRMLRGEWLARGAWYYLDDQGNMVTGLKKIPYNYKESYYLFAPSGAMLTGWQNYDNKTYYLQSGGAAVANEWLNIDGKRYYFDAEAAMVKDDPNKGIDGKYYYFNKDGSVKTGWVKLDGQGWVYYESTGARATGGVVDGFVINANGVGISEAQMRDADKEQIYYYLDSAGKLMQGKLG